MAINEVLESEALWSEAEACDQVVDLSKGLDVPRCSSRHGEVVTMMTHEATNGFVVNHKPSQQNHWVKRGTRHFQTHPNIISNPPIYIEMCRRIDV